VIQAVGVVVPAHNEQDLLPSCLAAAQRAARELTIGVHLVVVADACTDRTAALACDQGVTVVETGARNVGAARRVGVEQVLWRTRHLGPASVWLATTDADTLVPPTWLTRQLRYARRGWGGVVGTVRVADWADHPPAVPGLYNRRYRSWCGRHPHVHGANLGFSAAAYLAAGGFRPLPTAEDHALVNDLQAAGARLLRTTRIPVVTSARARARAPQGFGCLLAALAAPPPTAPEPRKEAA
jgi:glycosyltransferase involved in cell wall biosynthesis